MSAALPKSPQDFDPLDEALKPPINETEQDRVIRQAQEAEARRVSQAIDDSIRAEKQAQKKKGIVRLLLLGQSESDVHINNSDTLREIQPFSLDFQKLYTPTAFHEERVLWRSVIQLNIVRSVRTIFDALSDPRLPTLDSGGEDSDDGGANISQELEMLQMRLTPLRHIGALLIAKLILPREDEATSVIGNSTISAYHSQRSRSSEHSWRAQEVFVHHGATWKGALAKSTRARFTGHHRNANPGRGARGY
ncbi:G-protein alpha subunit-domain-containing protein [Suillus spraguei]|nr:G-protein alpha subunit-domain-containing protein [Suillus spraguei]